MFGFWADGSLDFQPSQRRIKINYDLMGQMFIVSLLFAYVLKKKSFLNKNHTHPHIYQLKLKMATIRNVIISLSIRKNLKKCTKCNKSINFRCVCVIQESKFMFDSCFSNKRTEKSFVGRRCKTMECGHSEFAEKK